jgi:hypothetical protein
MYKLLLALHIAAGSLALLAAAGAVIAPKGGRAHAWAGRAFTAGMALIFLTAVPMTFMRPNLFLFLIALFNGYLALSGWMRASNRRGIPTKMEWAAAGVMAMTAVGMGGRGIFMLAHGDTMGIVLLVFTAIGGTLAISDVFALRAQSFRGKDRIASHLTRMLGGTTGALTAFLVVNVRLEPAFVLWILPSLVMTPLIVFWARRVRRPARRHAIEKPYAEGAAVS